jgi:hypothetical protein
MRSSRTITLFSDRPDPVRLGIVLCGLDSDAWSGDRCSGAGNSVRAAKPPDCHRALCRAAPGAARAGAPDASLGRQRYSISGTATSRRKPPPRAESKARRRLCGITAQGAPGAQTLVQPKIKNPVTLAKEIPVPTAVIWSPEKAEVKTIVPPKPAPPTASEVKPVARSRPMKR